MSFFFFKNWHKPIGSNLIRLDRGSQLHDQPQFFFIFVYVNLVIKKLVLLTQHVNAILKSRSMLRSYILDIKVLFFPTGFCGSFVFQPLKWSWRKCEKELVIKEENNYKRKRNSKWKNQEYTKNQQMKEMLSRSGPVKMKPSCVN